MTLGQTAESLVVHSYSSHVLLFATRITSQELIDELYAFALAWVLPPLSLGRSQHP
jgi:hypothetical protein